VMDGFAFLRELRGTAEGRGIPVVVLTSRDLTAEDRERLQGHVADVLSKGAYTRDALLREVRELVGRRATGPAPDGAGEAGACAGGRHDARVRWQRPRS